MEDLSRRGFLGAGAAALTLSMTDPCLQAAIQEKLGTHHVPPDKNLDKTWVENLFAKGKQKVYRGEELACIGMPIGGICAGQLYLRGDGTLGDWSIFNHEHFTGFGDNCYRTYTPPSPVKHGFALWFKPKDGPSTYRTLDRTGFPAVEFVGEYPIGRVNYQPGPGENFPLNVSLEAFSPFCPLDARGSATPGTVLRFTIRNHGPEELETALGGWLQNVVCARHAGSIRGTGRNHLTPAGGTSTLVLSAEDSGTDPAVRDDRPDVFADFESGTYAGWKKSGEAFGDTPASGTLPGQQPVTGFGGKYLVNSFFHGDATTGTLTSAEFTLKKNYIYFRIGGGNNPGATCMNLLVDGKIARTSTGKNNERLDWTYWDVSNLLGKKASLEIVDRATGGWGHINIDDITFADRLPGQIKKHRLADQPDFGTLALSILVDEQKKAAITGSTESFEPFRLHGALVKGPDHTFPLGEYSEGGLAAKLQLKPGAEAEVTFLLTWHFPRSEHGQMYGNWFSDATAVAHYLWEQRFLGQATRLFHDTYYDSTLPHWLLDRLMMPISTLATDTVQWWKNGRFWAWEGVGCCNGTCTHVWNYAQGLARLFPELERSARTMQDLGVAFDVRTGRVGYRGEDPGAPYAADGQCGTVLKCYREHLLSPTDAFLKSHWPRIKKIMEYAIQRDGNADGILEDKQWNTFDLDFVGPNTFVGALYLAALTAAARMADLQEDHEFARRCRLIAQRGRDWTEANLWNGEYFVQRIPAGQSSRLQYGDGCLADQLLGQTWAAQLGLGEVYHPDKIRTALRSIYRYNWAPNVAAQNQAYPPQRWFARPGDAGLFTCTWPRGGRMQEPVLYRDEVWTGSEYEVASLLIHEGMVREGLSIIRGIHERYDGRRHNPWNEVECGDHYARALASWGCFVALCGFSYDGPAARLGFAPRMQAEEFKAFFSAAEGWGSLSQKQFPKAQENEIVVKYGKLSLGEWNVEVPADATIEKVSLQAGQAIKLKGISQSGTRVRILLSTRPPAEEVVIPVLGVDDVIKIRMEWRGE